MPPFCFIFFGRWKTTRERGGYRHDDGIYDRTVPCGIAADVRKGQTVTVVDAEGGQVADFFAEMRGDADEFLSTGVTIDCNESLRLRVGDTVYTNLYRPMFRVVSDDVGEHDLLHPCCRPEMYDFFYGNGQGHPNCLDNINRCLNKTRPIIHPVNLFMHTKIGKTERSRSARPFRRRGIRSFCSPCKQAAPIGKNKSQRKKKS